MPTAGGPAFGDCITCLTDDDRLGAKWVDTDGYAEADDWINQPQSRGVLVYTYARPHAHRVWYLPYLTVHVELFRLDSLCFRIPLTTQSLPARHRLIGFAITLGVLFVWDPQR